MLRPQGFPWQPAFEETGNRRLSEDGNGADES
jgi:hypothetical protein